jgi:hypothetical protein
MEKWNTVEDPAFFCGGIMRNTSKMMVEKID